MIKMNERPRTDQGKDVVCPTCGKNFEPSVHRPKAKGKMYCSLECLPVDMEEPEEQICDRCGMYCTGGYRGGICKEQVLCKECARDEYGSMIANDMENQSAPGMSEELEMEEEFCDRCGERCSGEGYRGPGEVLCLS
ncbi:MAG: hypothetical protein KGY38_06495, partial [Desulfobacterales bacterium]|nr:hypothetical protein [Desulfobacterales bacterium]